ncbi:glycosyltransferase family 1 protein [Anaeromyxobacter sp. PSR-1]|uniref:glycosyltransferase family 4 protein n=1 Tax=Anaeromyxobacter sp. PSR-1 TaxID=1300915 RepID=UPI0005E71567|nr:glycosyltransferase family 1 protein [Anaeromyxobacter sp. PSR-1]GAO02283.1 D-inositol 3-phosphate glycosyltransferase [Anaeromyxobacter sp. PSR-1]
MRRLLIVDHVMSAGGVERVLHGLIGALIELPEAREWDITLLLARHNSAGLRCEWPSALVAPNVHVEWLGERTRLGRTLNSLVTPRRSLAARLPFLALRRLGPRVWRARAGDPGPCIAEVCERFDVAYFTWPLGMAVPRVAIPVVTTPADFNFKHFLGKADPVRWVTERHMKAWLARADRLLLTSESVRDELRQYYPEHAGRTEVVRLGVDAVARPPSAEALDAVRRTRNLPDRFVLMAGWVAPHKNQLALIEAMSALRSHGTSVPVVFVGPNAEKLGSSVPASGWARPYVEQVRSTLGRLGFVHGRDYHALGFVSDDELECLYRLASAFVLPSLYEGFGLPGLEAMRAGCPTLLAAIPPLREQDHLLGGVARMFDPRDSAALARELESVLGDRPGALAQAALAADRVPRVFDWRKTARAYLRVFAEAMDRPRRAPRPASGVARSPRATAR